jgi:hypothetical protein
MKRTAVFCTMMLAALVCEAQAGSARLRISVSATVPPPPCIFPDPCAPAPTALSTAAFVGGTILYVGWRPRVVRESDLMVVLF